MVFREGLGPPPPQQAFVRWNDPIGNPLIALNRDGTISSYGIMFPDGTIITSAAQPVEQQPLITVTGNYEPLAANYKILMSASGTVTLNSSLPAGTTFVIKNTSASGTVTVHPTSGLIDDQSSFSMTSGFGQLPSIEVTFDGTNWWIF